MAVKPEPIKAEYIRVLVSARQSVSYAQYRDIPEEKWAEYNRMCDQETDEEDFLYAFGHLIDRTDVLDADELEDLELQQLGEDFEPVSP